MNLKNPAIILTVTLVLLTACATHKFYVHVPYESSNLYDTHEWFSCADCQDNYDLDLAYFIQDSRITSLPRFWVYSEYSGDLELLHNTLSTIGYSNLMSHDFYEKHVKGFIDSVQLADNRQLPPENYFSKFILRREADKTKNIVLRVLNDVQSEFETDEPILVSGEIDEHLATLIEFDRSLKARTEPVKTSELVELFDYLKYSGNYAKAYEITHRPLDFDSIGISKDSLLLTLPLDTLKYNQYTDSTIELGYFSKEGNWTDLYLMWLDYPGP